MTEETLCTHSKSEWIAFSDIHYHLISPNREINIFIREGSDSNVQRLEIKIDPSNSGYKPDIFLSENWVQRHGEICVRNNISRSLKIITATEFWEVILLWRKSLLLETADFDVKASRGGHMLMLYSSTLVIEITPTRPDIPAQGNIAPVYGPKYWTIVMKPITYIPEIHWSSDISLEDFLVYFNEFWRLCSPTPSIPPKTDTDTINNAPSNFSQLVDHFVDFIFSPKLWFK
jgi:hypothetical protein